MKSERFNRRRYVRVADSVLHEAWDNETLATAVRLMAYLNTRWARNGLTADEAGEAEIPAAALMVITGRRRFDYALQALSKLAASVNLTATKRGDSVHLSWPKFAEFQGYREQVQRQSASRDPRPASREKKNEGANAPSAAEPAPPPAPVPTPGPGVRGRQLSVFPGGVDGPEPGPRRSPLANLLGACGAVPAPEADERDAWLETYLPEIEAAAEAEAAEATGSDTPPRTAVGARVRKIALARWRTYLRGDRPLRGVGARRARHAALERVRADSEAAPQDLGSDDFDVPMGSWDDPVDPAARAESERIVREARRRAVWGRE